MPPRSPASFALRAFALAMALCSPRLASADVPPPEGGAGVDPNCTVSAESVAGSTCAECVIANADTSCQLELGPDYNFACQQSPMVQVWCNGPARTMTVNPSCAFARGPVPGRPAGGAALNALIAIAAWSTRRRRR